MNRARRSRSNVPVADRGNQPQKRLKVSHSQIIDSAAILNECGKASYQKGKYEEARQYFSQALCGIDVGFLCESIQSSVASKQEHLLLIKPSMSVEDKAQSSNPSSSSSPPSQPQSTPSSLGLHSLLYLYQRHEYDEGMEVNDTPLSLPTAFMINSRPSTLFYNIALTHVRQGQYEMAIDTFGKALSRINASAEDLSSLVVKLLHGLGYCFYRVGLNAEAMRRFEEALTLSIRDSLGERTIAATLNCIGVLQFHEHADDSKTSMNTLKESLEMYQSLPTSETKEVATVLNNIGRVYYLWTEYDKALEIYDKALKLRMDLLGKDSIDVAATMYNAGQSHHQLGNLLKAMEFYQKFLDLARAKLGEESRDVAIVYRCIAEINHERGHSQVALYYFEKALKCGRSSLGKNHPEVASTLNKIGNLCYEMNDHDSALKYYKEGLAVERKVLEPDHPHIIITLTNIAHIYKHRGDYKTALKAYRQALRMQRKTLGIDSIECAASLSSIGLMQYHLKAYDAAFDSYQDGLRIRRDFHGSDEHLDVASTLNSIGLVLFKQEMYKLSRQCFMESLRIRKKLLGPDHRDVAILWYNIATIYFETGQEDIAVTLYKETLRVERAALGTDHPDIVLTLQHIGQVLQQQGDFTEALKYYQEALAMERKRGTDKLAIAKILNLIGNIFLQEAKVEEMVECFVEASRIYEEKQRDSETLVISGYNFYSLSRLHRPCAAVA